NLEESTNPTDRSCAQSCVRKILQFLNEKLAVVAPVFHFRIPSVLQRCRRRTRTNPVSARSRFDSDNRTVSRLQTADSRCSQRQNRNRAAWPERAFIVRFADHTPESSHTL